MKKYLFTLSLLLICAAGIHANIKDLHFLNTGYTLHKKYIPQLIDFSLKHNIHIENLQNWIMAESSGREKAYNRKSRDYGLCQLHDVDYLVNKYWDPDLTGAFDIWNGEHNLFIGLAYLSDLIKEFGVYKGFIAYNTGQTRVRAGKILQVGIKYVSSILPGEKKESEKLPFIADNFKLVLIFKEQELYDKRGLYEFIKQKASRADVA